jgi:hypothetical protein
MPGKPLTADEGGSTKRARRARVAIGGNLRRASLRGCGFGALVLVIACVGSASAPAADLPLQHPSTQSLPQAPGLRLDSPDSSGASDSPVIPAIAVGLALLTPLVAVVLFRRRPERGLTGASGDGQTTQVTGPARAAPPWGLPPYEESPPPATGVSARARAVSALLSPPQPKNGSAPVRPGLIRSALITFGPGQFLRNRR